MINPLTEILSVKQLQDEFADFVQSVEKSKFECIGKKEKFEIEKDTFVHKYFR